MLLKLEVDGFKNLVGFSASFGPFTCIAGENGVGTSNVFDAIDFLSLTAEHPLLEAAGLVRASGSDPAGDPEHLFTAGRGRRAMRFAAEIVVPTEVTDDFGEVVAPSISLLRYELEIGVDEPNGSARQGRLVVEREELRHINRGDAARHLRFPHDARQFRSAVVVGDELDAVAVGAGGFKSVRGEWGSGKTFTVRWIGEQARTRGFATAEVRSMRARRRCTRSRRPSAESEGLVERRVRLHQTRSHG